MGFYTPTVDNLIRSKFDLGLKNYPIFNENYRERLNNKILDHYRFREIGLETPTLFKFYLNRKLNEIMPYYNQLYMSELLEFDPITNYEFTEKFDGLHKGNKVDTNHKTENETKDSDMFKDGTENEDKNERESIGTDTSEHSTLDSSTNVDEVAGREESNHTSTDSQSSTTNTDNPDKDGSTSWSKNVFSDTPQGLLSNESWQDPATDNAYATNAGYTVTKSDLKDKYMKTDTDNDSTSQTDGITSRDDVMNRDTLTSETNDSTKSKSEDRETSYDKGKQYQDSENYSHAINAVIDAIGTSDVDNTDDNLTHLFGYKNVSPSTLLNKFRETFLNIDMMIIDELSELFMSIY